MFGSPPGSAAGLLGGHNFPGLAAAVLNGGASPFAQAGPSAATIGLASSSSSSAAAAAAGAPAAETNGAAAANSAGSPLLAHLFATDQALAAQQAQLRAQAEMLLRQMSGGSASSSSLFSSAVNAMGVMTTPVANGSISGLQPALVSSPQQFDQQRLLAAALAAAAPAPAATAASASASAVISPLPAPAPSSPKGSSLHSDPVSRGSPESAAAPPPPPGLVSASGSRAVSGGLGDGQGEGDDGQSKK